MVELTCCHHQLSKVESQDKGGNVKIEPTKACPDLSIQRDLIVSYQSIFSIFYFTAKMYINDLYNFPRAIHVIISTSELDHATYVAPLVWLQSPYQLQAYAAGRMQLHQSRYVSSWCHHP